MQGDGESYDAAFFDAVYAEGDGDPWGNWDSDYEREKCERTLTALRDRQPPGDCRAILDLGCGNGAKTAQLVEAYPDANVLGVDVSAEALAVARERVPDADFARADVATFLETTQRRFDAVVDVECLCYLAAECSVTELFDVADRLAGVLREDGVLVGTHVHVPRGSGPSIEEARTAQCLRRILETSFETVGRERYDERKAVALDEDEPERQPYEVWTMVPNVPDGRGGDANGDENDDESGDANGDESRNQNADGNRDANGDENEDEKRDEDADADDE